MTVQGGATEILRLPTVDSTNSEALRQWRAGRRKELWIISEEQTAGRGRESRSWISQQGNLYASLLLPVEAPQRTVPQLSLVTSLAVHETVRQFCPTVGVSLKWPNDCLVQGAKIAGILIESVSANPLAVCIGIGINIAHAPGSTHYPATFLAAYATAGTSISRSTSRSQETSLSGKVFSQLSTNLSRWLAIWNDGGGFALIRGEWCKRSVAQGEVLNVGRGDQTVTGRYIGLGEHGELLLELPGGHIENIFAGDVLPAREYAA